VNSIALPSRIDDALSALIELVRRAIDGTVVPLVVDTSNQRVLIGTTTAATSLTNGKLEIKGDIRIQDGGNGIIVPTPDGTKLYRITVDNDGRLDAYQVL